MKKILIVAAFACLLIPALASAELNYNAVDVSYAATSYSNSAANQTELGLGYSRSTSNEVYLMASYGAANQPASSTQGVKKLNSISVGAGYHTRLYDKTDAIAEGHLNYGSGKLAGTSTSAHGYDMGAGVRSLFGPTLEGTLKIVHASAVNGAFSKTNTFLRAQFGFNFLAELQMTASIDFKPDTTSSLGVRFFY